MGFNVHTPFGRALYDLAIKASKLSKASFYKVVKELLNPDIYGESSEAEQDEESAEEEPNQLLQKDPPELESIAVKVEEPAKNFNPERTLQLLIQSQASLKVPTGFLKRNQKSKKSFDNS